MRKNASIILSSVFVILLCTNLAAQDMQFSQVYSNPLYLNPAFAGTNDKGRVNLNYRRQWPGLENEYEAYGAGTDFYIRSLRGGIGFAFVKDIAGIHNLSNSRASLSYSQHLNLNRKSTLALGFKGSLGQRSFDDGNLLFADQVINETDISESNFFISESVIYGDVSVGLLYYRDMLWVGASAHHLNKPNQSFLGSEEFIPVKYSLHGGAEIPLPNNSRRFRLAFNYKTQGEWDQLDLGGIYSIHHLNLGVWYRGIPFKPYLPGYQNNEAIVLLLGFEMSDHWSVGYSYDVTISRLTGYAGGAHEIAMIYEFSTRPRVPRRRIIPCAKF